MSLNTTLEKVLEAHKNADTNGKKLLEDLYGKQYFLSIFDRVTSYETACEVLNLTPKSLSQFEQLFNKDQARRQFARHKLQVACEAINEGWVADFENENQYKYYNWMYNKKNGLRLFGTCNFDCSHTSSDLCLETAKKCDHVALHMKSEYATYLFGY